MNHSLLIVAIVVALVPLSSTADGIETNQQTSAVPDGRFEIVQSTLLAKDTFRLDRFNGYVHQLVRTRSGENAWELTPVTGLPKVNGMRARFQIFVSSIASRFTFLIDTATGMSWQLQERTDKGIPTGQYVWVPFEEDT